ncbi:MAG: PTS ascorbate transporter subunit IIC, partial [Bifidobacteriaceae bacterium]|nr:PTS ascorbate transporter subunit IIC [Bifidobacteriaceae bacterium]
MNSTLKTIVDIISVPAILVALIALLGLLLQKKPTSETIKGTIKTFIGFLVITAGAGIVEKSLTPFSQMFIHAFNVQGVVPNNEAIVSIALTKLGSLTALIMFAGMIINILIARFSQLKYIYLTGHAMLYMSCMFAVILDGIGVDFLLSILLGGLALGLSNTLFPALAQPFMKDITQNESVALGHTGDAGYALSGFIGKLINKKGKSKSTEDISFPKSLSFLRDSSVAIALTMSIVYIIVAIFAGSDFITNELSSGQNFIVYAIIQAGTFAAGIVIILQGVR